MSKAEKFYEKLENLQAETGYEYEIKDKEEFDKHIEDNTLFAGWFKPGTVLAIVETEAGILNFRVSGPLEARLVNSDGETVHTFNGVYDHFEDDDVLVHDDKDIEALIAGNHPSGYHLLINEENKVEVIIGAENIEPVYASDPSVARCILDKKYVEELIKASEFESEARREALEAVATELGFEELPDPPSPPDEEEKPVESDIPEYENYIKEHPEEAEENTEADACSLPDPIKEEKKTKKAPAKAKTKKANASKAKQGGASEENTSDEESVGRFDLLPLDIISRILAGEIDATGSKDMLTYIEDYKNTGNEEALISAAMYIAGGYFPSSADFVMALAILVEKEAEEYGEDAWKEKDAVRCINEAIKNWLLSIRDKDLETKGILLKSAWCLICAAWIAKNR